MALGRHAGAPRCRLSAGYPDIRLELDLNDRLVNLSQEGLTWPSATQAPPDTHVAWALCASRSLLVASPDYLRRPRHAPDELAAPAGCTCAAAAQSWQFVRQRPTSGREWWWPVNAHCAPITARCCGRRCWAGWGWACCPTSAAAHLPAAAGHGAAGLGTPGLLRRNAVRHPALVGAGAAGPCSAVDHLRERFAQGSLEARRQRLWHTRQGQRICAMPCPGRRCAGWPSRRRPAPARRQSSWHECPAPA